MQRTHQPGITSRVTAGRTSRKLVLSAVHVCIFLLILFFADVKFEVSDDFVMELLASGAFTGKPDFHLMFSSCLWGRLLVFLYGLNPAVNWYYFMQAIVCLLSFIAVSFCFDDRFSFRFSLLLSIVTEVTFAADLYILPQFTKTAAAAIAAGGLLFVSGAVQLPGTPDSVFGQAHGGPPEERGQRRIYVKAALYLFLGALLVVSGCLIRHNALYIAGIHVVIFLGFCAVSCLKSGFSLRQIFLRLLLPACLLAAAVFGLRIANNLEYSKDPEYAFYMDYSYVRAHIVDYPLPDYEEIKGETGDAGISENDYNLIVHWLFADREVFSLEKMQSLLQILDGQRSGSRLSFIRVILRFLGRGIPLYPGTLFCITAAALYIVIRRKIGMPLIAAGPVMISMLIFISMGHAVYRVEFGLLFSAGMMLLLCAGSDECKRAETLETEVLTFEPFSVRSVPDEAGIRGSAAGQADCFPHSRLCHILPAALAIVLIFLYIPDRSYTTQSDEVYRRAITDIYDDSWGYHPLKYRKVLDRRQAYPAFLNEVREHPETLYLLDFNTAIQTLYFDFDPREALPAGQFENMIYIGGVTVNHPVIEEALARYGAEEGLSALLHENVCFVSNGTEEEVRTFLREHYDAKAEISLYNTIDGLQIWKYHA